MIPARYAYIAAPGAPKMLREAAKLYGLREKEGAANNPAILRWANEVEQALGAPLGYNADSIPWCGLFAAVCAVRGGWVAQMPRQPLWARNWAKFGQRASAPALGDILVFSRGGSGHVGFYVGEEAGLFHVLGGNQGDAVSIARVEKSRLIACRRPRWRISEPASVRPHWFDASGGAVSRNEA